MKNILKGMAALLFGAAVLTACGDDSTEPQGHIPAIDVTTRTLVPDATGANGESGSTRAFVGTVVTAQGFNLDRVSRVTMNDTEAEIVGQSISELKFKIPALGFAQRDDSYLTDLLVYGEGGEVVFRYEYYVTVPVTDAVVTGYAPASGTVGTVVRIEGRNLEQLAEVRFGDKAVLSDAFVEVVEGSESSSVSFAVPAGEWAAGESEVAIAAVWGGSNVVDVTGETPFTMQTPRVAPVVQPEGENAAIGDDLVIEGEFLDLVSEIRWGAYELIVLEQTAVSVTVKFPSSIEPADPVVAAADIAAVYGTPAQAVVLAAAYRVDTTPQGPAKPIFKSFAAEDGGADNRLYLGKTVTVTGENMASVEGFLVDGVAAVLVGEPNDVQASFAVPDGVTFTSATEVAVEALYGGGTKAEMFTAKVYPFYCYKGIRLGLGSNSKNTYTEYAAENAFFYPDLGRTVSTQEWVDGRFDRYVVETGTNPAVKEASTLTKSALTSEEYYAVKPYVFFITNSSSKLSIAGCANSASQIKTHCTGTLGAWTSLPSTFGTPIVMYRVMNESWGEAVKSGTLESMAAYDGALATAGAPAFGAAETTSVWVEGSVLMMNYITYAKGGKPVTGDDASIVAKIGFIHVTGITCADKATGLANADRAGYIEFDMYWSKQLNE
ncbi:MAG: hypothetical protein K2J33_05440 [Alistipes sp.]|nr:hypothetical protein [Alistipes sp.]